MARSGIYKSEVVRARDKLLALGRHPSIDAVRIELGNTGSKATIHRYLKEIEQEQGGATGSEVSASDAIQDLVSRLAERLNEEADQRANLVSAKAAEKIQALSVASDALKSEIRAGLTQLERSQLALTAEQKTHGLAQGRLHDLEARNAAQAQEVRGLRERLEAQDLHRQSLEEKHLHARDSLAHFMQSAKEQREQDTRKHAQEVLYLQGEVTNANKVLASKQHEATAAHQECSRLLAELNQAHAQLHSAKEEARGLRQNQGDLLHAQKMLEDRGRDLVLQQALTTSLEETNLALNARVDLLAQRCQQLEVQLATALTSVEAQKSVVAAFVQGLAATSPT